MFFFILSNFFMLFLELETVIFIIISKWGPCRGSRGGGSGGYGASGGRGAVG